MDLTSKVLTVFKSDTSDLEAGLKRLQGEEKKQQQALLDTAKARNAGYDEWLGRMANVNQALELGVKVVSFLGDAWKEYADDVKLAAAIGSTNIDKLRHASLGLRTEQELMEFAAKANNGQIKASQEQMETAQRAMVALTRAGFDQKEVTDKVTTAMISLKTRGLESLGVTIKEGGTDLEKFNNLMAALGAKAQGVDESSLTASEGIQKMGISMSDSFDNMKAALGSLVQAMSPLIEALAAAVGLIAEITIASTKDINWIDAANKQLGVEAITRDKDINVGQLLGQSGNSGGVRQPLGSRDRWDDGGAAGIDEGAFYTWSNGVLKKLPGKPGKPAPSKFSDYASVTGQDTAGAPMGFGSQVYGSVADTTQRDMYGNEIEISTQALLGDKTKALTDDWMQRLEAQQAKKTTFLESTFGKVEEINLYAESFTAFSGAVGAGYDVIVTGSGSASAAFKKMLADSLAGIGKKSAVEALKELAYAAGSAAFGDFGGAALHLKSAGLHTAVAVAAGVAANQIGTSGQVAASDKAAADKAKETEKSKGGSSGGGNPGGGSSDKERPIYILMGENFGDSSPRQRRNQAENAVERALRERDE